MPENDVAEMLENAVKDDTVDSAATEEALDNQAEARDEKAKAETAKTESGQKTQKQSQAVPYDRFKEQNDALKDALERIEELSERDKELSVKAAQYESDHDVLERLRGLASDDRYRSLVETLDKALRGIHEDVESGEKTEKQGEDATKKLFDDHKQELEEAIAEQRAELLWQQASSLSDQLLDALGDDYDDNDREAIARYWNPETDWDAIEEDPSTMKDELLRSLQAAVEAYGPPRGALHSKLTELEEKSQQTPETAKKSSEEVLQGLIDKDWGAVKRDQEGKVVGPEHSDEDFKNVLARVLRQGR